MLSLRFLLLLLLLFTTSCSLTKKLTAEQSYIDSIYKSGELVKSVESIKLSELDILKVTHVLNRYTAFKEKYNYILTTDDAKSIIVSEDFLNDYTSIRNQYTILESVISSNWERYSEQEQAKLLEYRSHALALNESMERMLRLGKVVSVVKLVVKSGVTAAKMAGIL